jgi:hypothetical protein
MARGQRSTGAFVIPASTGYPARRRLDYGATVTAAEAHAITRRPRVDAQEYGDRGGIKSGMQITASPEHVVQDIGTKKMTALRKIVEGGREDYREYRSAHPVWASQDCGRTTHSLIHERMWQRAMLMADDFEDVSYVESLPTRELYLGTQYRVRFKKHTPAGAVRSYPTATALDFFDEPPRRCPRCNWST